MLHSFDWLRRNDIVRSSIVRVQPNIWHLLRSGDLIASKFGHASLNRLYTEHTLLLKSKMATNYLSRGISRKVLTFMRGHAGHYEYNVRVALHHMGHFPSDAPSIHSKRKIIKQIKSVTHSQCTEHNWQLNVIARAAAHASLLTSEQVYEYRNQHLNWHGKVHVILSLVLSAFLRSIVHYSIISASFIHSIAMVIVIFMRFFYLVAVIAHARDATKWT